MDNYSQLIERIARMADLQIEEVERKVEAKKAKLSGLISKEGAAQIVAAELGLNFDNEKLKISELVEGMKRANVTGKIVQINPVRAFNKSGKEGKVASAVLADDTANVRLVMWDMHHIEQIEKNQIKEGDVIEITGGGIRNGELHLSSFGELKLSKQKFDAVVMEKAFHEKRFKDVRAGENLKARAFIVNTFEPKYFEVNPETGKKFTEEDKNNGLRPKKRALLTLTLDDGTDTLRSVLFGEQINKLGLTDEEIFSLEEFNKKKNSIIGEELYFTGQIKLNSFSNANELSITDIQKVEPSALIKELEATKK